MQTRSDQAHSDSGANGFWYGVIAGGVIGAGLAVAFAPRLKEITTRIVGVVDGATSKGQAVRNDVADAVGRGARVVEQFAVAAKVATGSKS